MKSFLRFPVFFAFVLMMVSIALGQSSKSEAKVTLSSPAFQAGGTIPDQFTCKGANLNPPLQFSGIPAGAKSIALIVDDPDAPGGLFSHWVVWNIDPVTTQIGEKSIPAGAVQGTNDFGKPGYGGPCPPSGTHRYFFRIFALDRELDLPVGAKRSQLDTAIKSHVIAKGELMGRYARKK